MASPNIPKSSTIILSLSPAAILGFLFLLYILYQYIIYPALLSPLASIPNAHWSAPYSRLWILLVRVGKKENVTLFAAHKRMGSNLVRVAPNELSVDGVEGVKVIYGGGWGKGEWYEVFDNFGVPCTFSASTSSSHTARKRLTSHVYSKSYIQASTAARAQARDVVFRSLLPALEAERAGVDIYAVLMATTMDFIAAYIFGRCGGTDFLGDKAYRNHFFELYRARAGYGVFDQEVPWLTGMGRKVGVPLCPGWVDAANAEIREWCWGLCEASVEKKSRGSGTGRDQDESVVWNALVSGLEREAEKGRESVLRPWPQTKLYLSAASELMDHVLAGQETAGLALTYLVWRLSRRLEVQAELQAELLGLKPNMQAAVIDGKRSTEIPDLKQLDNLPVLHAVLIETLRLHAPIPGPQPRQSPCSGGRIGDYVIPGGVRVAALAYTLHRDEDVFPDPESWDHTRWLASHATEDELARRNKQFWAFSSGGRMCVGSNFAMHEMKLIAGAIYSNFTTHIFDDEGVSEPSDGYTGRPSRERLYLQLEPLGCSD